MVDVLAAVTDFMVHSGICGLVLLVRFSPLGTNFNGSFIVLN
jgi:hypothetical protein